ncbi:mediator complex, subunit Med18 [Xylariomycetidae sp. FL2044]|nr:mediator complex, subunit Med18 [Xylariomycetidae sp. FL2044]
MRELFLTSSVKDGEFDMACAIFQGLTWMTARPSLHRILFVAGPPQPKGLPNTRAFRQKRDPAPWNELHKQLTRSSYVLQAAYEVSKDADFGRGTEMQFNSLDGMLLWMDLPDPLRESPITSRKKIEIHSQRDLLTGLAENAYGYKNELVQERYTFVRDNVEFVLSRYYHLPDSPGRPVAILPAWQDLRPVDPAQKWVLNVKLSVVDDAQPEKMKKASEELLRVKAELDKLFEFKVLDRRVFDTRIAPPPVIPGRGPT